MQKINGQKAISSILIVSSFLQACGMNRPLPSNDGSVGGACTKTVNGQCVDMEFDTDPNGDIIITSGSERPNIESNDAVINPGDANIGSEDFPIEDWDDDDSSGGESGGSNGGNSAANNRSQGGKGFFEAIGEGLSSLGSGLMEGLGGIFGNTKKQAKEKKRRILKAVEEAQNLKKQTDAIENSVRENYIQSADIISKLNDSSYDQPNSIRDSLNAAGHDHNRQLEDLIRSRPSLNEINPDNNVCRELGICNYQTPEQYKVSKAREYLKGARSSVDSRFSGTEKKIREGLIDIGNDLIDAAHESYENGDLETADRLTELGLKFADMAIGATPIVGDLMDIASAIAGQNLITGEELSDEEAIAQAGSAIFSLASGSVVGAVKDVAKAGKILKSAIKKRAREEANKKAREEAEHYIEKRERHASEGQKAAQSIQDAQSAADFKKSISKMPDNERVSAVRVKAEQVAKKAGWQKNNKLSKKNNRPIYTDSEGNHWSVDTRHGEFEKLNPRGQHQGVFEFDLTRNASKPADLSGRHDIFI